MRRSMGYLSFTLVACLSPWAVGQNLLINGSFENAGSPCSAGNGWVQTPGTNNCLRDGTTHFPAGGAYEGSHYGSVDEGGPPNGKTARITQTVTLTTSGLARLVGAITGGQINGSSDHYIRIHDGADINAPSLAQFVDSGTGVWRPFDISGTPTGSQITVSWGYENVVNAGWNIVATHVDALSLTQAGPSCSGHPAITSVAPAFGVNNATLNGFQVTGQNFDATCQVILRRTGFTDIQATGEAVGGGGTTITCNVPLNGAAMGKWTVVVTKDQCNEAALNNGLVVAYPTLTNGSFESPTAPASCPNPPAGQSAPSGWLQSGVSTGTNHLMRDSDQYPPSCPRPDGDQYASMLIPQGTSFGHWKVYQYIAVTPGQAINICGQFAGGGRLKVYLRLRDGDENGTVLSERLIFDREGCPAMTFNWAKACVNGTPAGGLVTVEWRLEARGTGSLVTAAHADALQLSAGPPPAEICNNGIDDDGDRRTDCQDSDCSADPNCPQAPVEICNNGIDDDGDVRVDCDDSDCASQCVEICGNGIDDDQDCQVDENCEICNNGQDDNDNGLVDCEDPQCSNFPGCGEICDNGVDDDNDGLVDCLDPNCKGNAACPCHDVWADADQDGDVDQDDFGIIQACFTGTLSGTPGPLPLNCVCFDRNADRDIDQPDIAQFQNCGTGPNVPFDINNPPPGCDLGP